jgi:hypothetical protein
MTVTTGILTLGKMSVGVRRITVIPSMRIRRERTTKVYGLRNARRTIHIQIPNQGGRLKLVDVRRVEQRIIDNPKIHPIAMLCSPETVKTAQSRKGRHTKKR